MAIEHIKQIVNASEAESGLVAQRFRDTEKDIDTLFDVKYGKINRLNAKSFVEAIKGHLHNYDVFIQENEEQANSFFQKALADLKVADELMPENDPYRKAVRELRGAIWHIYISQQYRDFSFVIQFKEVEKLIGVIEELKDTELEVQKHESEKSIYADVVNTLKGQIEQKDKFIGSLMDKVSEMQSQVRAILSKFGVEPEYRGGHASETAQDPQDKVPVKEEPEEKARQGEKPKPRAK